MLMLEIFLQAMTKLLRHFMENGQKRQIAWKH